MTDYRKIKNFFRAKKYQIVKKQMRKWRGKIIFNMIQRAKVHI